MKFPALEIENFLAITEAKISLSDRGLVLIQGENNANTSSTSNGSGKSSIADALCWCWFGTTARGVTGDEVINNVVKKNTRVSSTVIDNGITYTATRYRKHKTGKNSLQIVMSDGLTETDLTKGTDKLTQEVANQIIGCSHEVFAGSIYAGQEKMPDLPAMTDKQLKLLIEEAAGTTVLENAYRKAREDLAASQAKVSAIQGERDKTDHLLGLLRGQLSSTETMIEDWARQHRQREADAKGEIAAIIPKLKQLQDDINAFDVPAIEAAIKTCDDKIAAVADETVQLRNFDAAIATASGSFVAAGHFLSGKEREHAAAESVAAGIKHKLGCPCGECGRPLTAEELGAAQKNAEDRVAEKSLELAEAKGKRDAAEINLKSAQSARDVFAASMTDISAVAAQRASHERELASVRTLVSQQSVLKTTAKSLRDKMTAVAAETNPYEPQKAKLEADIAKQEALAAEINDRYLKAEDDLAVEQEVVKVFSPAGVRAHILDEVTPFLNEQTAKYLATLSDGNMEATWSTLTPDSKGVMKEKFTIDVCDTTGGDSFRGLSGGEKRKARIATALALQDLVATRATKPIDLFIGDEIDDALDPAGLERLMLILEDKARERGSVFIISHNELRDHIRQVMTVEKRADKTTQITETTA